MKTFGEQLSYYRERCGIPWKVLAEKVDRHRTILYRWASDKGRPQNVACVLEAAKALKLSESETVGFLAVAGYGPEYLPGQEWRVREAEAYFDMLRDRYGKLSLDGFPRGVKFGAVRIALDAVFVPPVLTYQSGADPNLTKGAGIDISDLLRLNRAVILGEAGAGKSTLLRYLAYAIAGRESDSVGVQILTKTPVFISIPKWVRCGRNQRLREYVLCEDGSLDRRRMLEQILDTGSALLLLDGLDIVSAADRTWVSRAVLDFALGGSSGQCANTVLLASRSSGYLPSRLLVHFHQVTLEGINQAHAGLLVKRLYSAISYGDESEQVVPRASALEAAIEEIPRVWLMASNPLLLTLMALLHWQGGHDLPKRRIDLYRKVIEMFFESWPVETRGVEVDSDTTLRVCEALAYHMLASESGGELDETMTYAVAAQTLSESQAYDERTVQEKTSLLIKQTVEQIGLLVDRRDVSAVRYSFAHGALTEYLAARHLAARWESGGLDLLPFARHTRWHNVVALAASHLSSPDEWTSRKDAKARCTRFVEQLMALPDEYPELQRNLLIAGECLALDATIDTQAAYEVVSGLGRQCDDGPLGVRVAAFHLLKRLSGTSYVTHVAHLIQDSLEKAIADRTDVMGLTLGLWRALVVEVLDAEHQIEEILGGMADMIADLTQTAETITAHFNELVFLASMDPRLNRAFVKLWKANQEDSCTKMMLLIAALTGGEAANELLSASVQSSELLAASVVCLGFLAFTDRRALDRVIQLSKEPGTKRTAIHMLGLLVNVDDLVVDRLLEVIRDEDVETRRGAITFLGLLARPDDRVIAGLLEATWDDDSEARQGAISGLGMLGATDNDVRKRLLELAGDEDMNVKIASLTSIVMSGISLGTDSFHVFRALEELLGSQDEEIVRLAGEDLVILACTDLDCLDRLFATLLTSEDIEMTRTAWTLLFCLMAAQTSLDHLDESQLRFYQPLLPALRELAGSIVDHMVTVCANHGSSLLRLAERKRDFLDAISAWSAKAALKSYTSHHNAVQRAAFEILFGLTQAEDLRPWVYSHLQKMCEDTDVSVKWSATHTVCDLRIFEKFVSDGFIEIVKDSTLSKRARAMSLLLVAAVNENTVNRLCELAMGKPPRVDDFKRAVLPPLRSATVDYWVKKGSSESAIGIYPVALGLLDEVAPKAPLFLDTHRPSVPDH